MGDGGWGMGLPFLSTPLPASFLDPAIDSALDAVIDSSPTLPRPFIDSVIDAVIDSTHDSAPTLPRPCLDPFIDSVIDSSPTLPRLCPDSASTLTLPHLFRHMLGAAVDAEGFLTGFTCNRVEATDKGVHNPRTNFHEEVSRLFLPHGVGLVTTALTLVA